MREMSVHEFRSHLREAVEEVVEDYLPLRVRRRGGQDFVVVSAEDWEREQETLYVLQNRSLMEQIERSLKTHGEGRDIAPLRRSWMRSIVFEGDTWERYED